MAVTQPAPAASSGTKMDFRTTPTYVTQRNAWNDAYNQQKAALSTVGLPGYGSISPGLIDANTIALNSARNQWNNAYNQQQAALGMFGIPTYAVPSLPGPRASQYATNLTNQGYEWDIPSGQWVQRSPQPTGTSATQPTSIQPQAPGSTPTMPSNTPTGTWAPRGEITFTGQAPTVSNNAFWNSFAPGPLMNTTSTPPSNAPIVLMGSRSSPSSEPPVAGLKFPLNNIAPGGSVQARYGYNVPPQGYTPQSNPPTLYTGGGYGSWGY